MKKSIIFLATSVASFARVMGLVPARQPAVLIYETHKYPRNEARGSAPTFFDHLLYGSHCKRELRLLDHAGGDRHTSSLMAKEVVDSWNGLSSFPSRP